MADKHRRVAATTVQHMSVPVRVARARPPQLGLLAAEKMPEMPENTQILLRNTSNDKKTISKMINLFSRLARRPHVQRTYAISLCNSHGSTM